MDLKNLYPERVFYHFQQLSAIPRGSGNEKAAGEYCVSVAKALGLYAVQDEFGNVLIRKPASKGYESSPGVIIQGHLDMVCEKNAQTRHDFEKDGINIIVDGDYIRADGTTLGADDGIAVAMALAVLESGDISHPPLECLFTADEEAGMNGANNFDVSMLQGTRLINIDSEEEGVFVSGCCGGAKAELIIPAVWEAVPQNLVSAKIKIRGLMGGHSGSDIHLQRANANKLMGRVLRQTAKTLYFRLESINGGLMDNAITRECDAVIYIDREDMEELKDICAQLQSIFAYEYAGSESGISVTAEEETETNGRVLKSETAGSVIYALNLLPNGVQRMSLDIDGLVETSNNVGIVNTSDDCISMVSAVRSSITTVKYELLEQLAMIAETNGGRLHIKSQYPGWEYDRNSQLRSICVEAYKEMFGREPEIAAIHAGLECGIFASKAKGLDMISIGPEMHDVHTPAERLSVPSVGRTWEFLRFLLKKL